MTAKLRLTMTIAAIAFVASPAWAGREVHGYGDTRLAAMQQTNEEAADEARRGGTCITTRATPQSCVNNNGVWDCYAIVANQQGSC